MRWHSAAAVDGQCLVPGILACVATRPLTHTEALKPGRTLCAAEAWPTPACAAEGVMVLTHPKKRLSPRSGNRLWSTEQGR